MKVQKSRNQILNHHFRAEKLRCSNCDEILNPTKAEWLELSQTDGNYYADKFPSTHQSQGCFPFGTTCAMKEIKKTLASLPNRSRLQN